MKDTLGVLESAELIRRKVNPEKASEAVYSDFSDCDVPYIVRTFKHPIFTLSDILSLLPKIIKNEGEFFVLDIRVYQHGWHTSYIHPIDDCIGGACAFELIDSLYKTLLWVIEQNHVKFN